MSTTVLSTIDSRGVATLTLNRPDKHNAFNDELIAELYDLLLQLEDYEAARVIVLTGAGKSFSAGADLAHMQRMAAADQTQNLEDTRAVARCLRKLAEFAKPVIARVNGNAFGGGVGLIACADIAIANDQAKFALSEVKLGLAAAIISPYVVAALGARQARRLLLTAASFSAAEARQLGLLHECVPAHELDRAVASQIELLLQGGPQAQRASKKIIADNAARSQDRDFIETHTARLLAELRLSPEGREGVSAFLEKRKPNWIK